MMKIDFTGNKELKVQFKRLKGASPEIVTEFVDKIVRDTHRNAVVGIQRGPASGTPRGDGSFASAPGEYPMSDTGKLAASVQFEVPRTSSRPEGFVGTNLMYGKFLEFKLPYQGGRPWLSRAFREATSGGNRKLERIFDKYVKRAL